MPRKKGEMIVEQHTPAMQEQATLPLLFEIDKVDQDQFSHTIELYDACPKYYMGRQDRQDGKYLPLLDRTFMHRGKSFKVTITPARLKVKEKDGNGVYREVEKDFYPGLREEIVEDALRKLATEGKGRFMDNGLAVAFSLYELRKELSERGHTLSYDQVVESIFICNRAIMSIKALDGDSEYEVSAPLFEMVGLKTKKDMEEQGRSAKCIVKFNTLVTKSIQHISFRMVNYLTCMSYSRSAARYLHKRMAAVYSGASPETPYCINVTTIYRDAGLSLPHKLSKAYERLVPALEELVEKEVAETYERIITKEGQKFTEIKICIHPTEKFVNEIIKANAHQKRLKVKRLREKGQLA